MSLNKFKKGEISCFDCPYSRGGIRISCSACRNSRVLNPDNQAESPEKQESMPEPIAKVVPDAVSEPEPVPERKVGSRSEVKPVPKPKPEPLPEPVAKPEPEPLPEPVAKPKAVQPVKAVLKPEPEPAPASKSECKSETGSESGTEPAPSEEAEAEPGPHSEKMSRFLGKAREVADALMRFAVIWGAAFGVKLLVELIWG